jgi:uncharacterized membrane protein
MMEIQKVPVSHGMLWIQHGYRLIMRSPLHAVSLAMTFMLGLMLAMLIPVGGIFLAMLLMPVLMAGYMRVCRALEYSEKVQAGYIFAGFKQMTAQLVSVGGMLLLGIITVSMLTVMLGGETLSTLLNSYQKDLDTGALLEAMLAPGSGMVGVILLAVVLLFTLMLALQYAPMLVFFDKKTPMQALKLSMRGSLRNVIPLSVYSMLMQLIAFAASVIPLNLGMLLLLPIALTSMYVSYRDIFSEVKTEEVAPATEQATAAPDAAAKPDATDSEPGAN